MPFYKDVTEKVHFLDSGDHAYLLPAGSVEITDEDAAALLQPSEAEITAVRIAAIDTRLAEIDSLSARPAREAALALLSGAPVDSYVSDKLTALEAEAAALRAERKELAQ